MEAVESDLLPWSAVPELMKFYLESEIDDYAVYLILENYHRWHKLYPDNLSRIFAPNGKVDSYGTFVLVIPENHNIVIDGRNPDQSQLKSLVQKCLNFYKENENFIVFGPAEKRMWSIIDEVVEECKLKRTGFSNCTCYFMDKEQGKTLSWDCPDDVYIDLVREEHAELINSVWPHRYDGSVNLIRSVISRNGGVGVFLKGTGELVSWALQSQYNGVGFLQTVEKHKRKGYGKLAASAITKYLAEKNYHSVLYIVDGNIASHTLFNHMGYKKIRQTVRWSLYLKI